ncbi:MAG: hypothetical protein JWQ24_995 [Tardiphaga sp.]|nr:hypothetical protein [Tardiphaga sp.]
MCRERHVSTTRFKRAAAAAPGADQIEVRGGWSGGGWPKPSGQKSFCGSESEPAVVNTGSNAASETPAKHLVMQAAMKTHLSQPLGTAAFDGQQGISLAISPAISWAIDSWAIDGAIVSSDMAAIGTSADDSAITGRDTGASASPAIIRIDSIRRMVTLIFTPQVPTERPGLIVGNADDVVMQISRLLADSYVTGTTRRLPGLRRSHATNRENSPTWQDSNRSRAHLASQLKRWHRDGRGPDATDADR